MITERIIIEIQERGAGRTAQAIRSVGSAADGAIRPFMLLRRALLLITGFRVLGRFTDMLDVITDLRNRLKLVTHSSQEAEAAISGLITVSRETRTSFEATNTVFTRAALSAQQLGISMAETMQFTRSLNQAVILSGVNAREAHGGLIQLSQGLASNRLSGDELRSVLENIPFVGDVIAKSMRRANGELGVTRGEFRKLAHEGKVTADVIFEGFRNARAELEERFKQTVPTISQAVEMLKLEMIALTRTFDDNTGTASVLARMILFLAQHVSDLAHLLGAGGLLGAMWLAELAMKRLTTAVRVFGAALLRNPIGVVFGTAVKVMSVAAALALAFSDKIKMGSDGLGILQDYLMAAFEIIQKGFMEAVETVGQWTGAINISQDQILQWSKTIGSFLWDVVMMMGMMADKFIGLFVGIAVSVAENWRKVGDIIGGGLRKGFNLASGVAENFVNFLIGGLNKVREFFNKELIPEVSFNKVAEIEVPNALAVGRDIANSFVKGFHSVDMVERMLEGTASAITRFMAQVQARGAEITQERIGREIVREASERWGLEQMKIPGVDKTIKEDEEEKLRRRRLMYEDIIRRMGQEQDLLRFNTREREIENQVFTARERLWRELKPHEEEAIRRLALLNQKFGDQRKIMDELQQPMIDLQRGHEALNALLNGGLITQAEYNRKLGELQTRALEMDTTFFGGMQRGAIAVHKEFTNLSTLIADNMTNAFKRAEDALVDFAMTGKLNVKDMVNSIIADFTRMAIRAAIMAPLAGMFAPGASTMPGGGAGASGAGQGFFSGLPGFKTGGAFRVGGVGGPDSQMVAFKASPDETVHVTKPGQTPEGGRPIQITYNISTPDADSFRKSQGQILAQTQAALGRAASRNN